MKTFEEFQTKAARVPVSLRNNRDRINLAVTGLQQEAGRMGALLAAAFTTGRFALTPEQRGEVHDRLADMLWYVALLCGESGIPMEEVAGHAVAQLQERTKQIDPEQ